MKAALFMSCKVIAATLKRQNRPKNAATRMRASRLLQAAMTSNPDDVVRENWKWK